MFSHDLPAGHQERKALSDGNDTDVQNLDSSHVSIDVSSEFACSKSLSAQNLARRCTYLPCCSSRKVLYHRMLYDEAWHAS